MALCGLGRVQLKKRFRKKTGRDHLEDELLSSTGADSLWTRGEEGKGELPRVD